MAQLQHREPDWIPTAPIVIRQTQRVEAPAASVWEVISDHERWPEWFTTLKRVQVTGEPAGVGGRREVTVNGITVGEVFTAWEPDAQFAFALVSGPRVLSSMAESVTIVDADEMGCTVEYVQGIEAAKGFGWLVKAVSGRMSKELGAALTALAARAEPAT